MDRTGCLTPFSYLQFDFLFLRLKKKSRPGFTDPSQVWRCVISPFVLRAKHKQLPILSLCFFPSFTNNDNSRLFRPSDEGLTPNDHHTLSRIQTTAMAICITFGTHGTSGEILPVDDCLAIQLERGRRLILEYFPLTRVHLAAARI